MIGTVGIKWIIKDAKQKGVTEIRIVLRRELENNIRYFSDFGFRYLSDFGTGKHDFYRLMLS